MSNQHKSKHDRLKEGISLLTQLKEGGVRSNVLSFMELKTKISNWVDTGIPWDGIIPFPEYGRIVELSLPKYNNKAAELSFKIKK